MIKVTHGGNVDEISQQLQIDKNKIYDFSANINPLNLPEPLKEILFKSLDEIKYYPDPNYLQLKQNLAKHLNVDTQTIFVGNGAIQLIFEIANSLPQSQAIVLAPTFGEYERAFKRAHFSVSHYYLDEKNNFQLKMNDFIAYLDQHPKIKIICLANPNNPTGNIINLLDLKKLVDLCNLQKRYLILDEAFIDLTVNNDKSYLLKLASNDNAFIIFSATKFFAIPGLRLGYCVVKNPKLQNMLRQQSEPWSLNILAARFGESMFNFKDYVRQTHQWLQEQQPKLYECLQGLDNLQVYPSTTNFILFRTSQIDLKTKLLKYRIMIRQCSDYVGLGPEYFRVAVKSASENKYLMESIKNCLKDE